MTESGQLSEDVHLVETGRSGAGASRPALAEVMGNNGTARELPEDSPVGAPA